LNIDAGLEQEQKINEVSQAKTISLPVSLVSSSKCPPTGLNTPLRLLNPIYTITITSTTTTIPKMATLPPSVPPTHKAIAITAPRHPLQLTTLPTHPPLPSEALIRVTWTASTPLNLHRADGGLLLGDVSPTNPFILGSEFAGTVVALGSEEGSSHLKVGDEVFGFVQDGVPREAGFQEYVTVPVWRVSKVPRGMRVSEAVAVPTNLVTAMHTVSEDLGLEVPW
jgi:hypothetical protein